MSSLLKQDTFYNQYGDPGRIYTYPDRVNVSIKGFDGQTLYFTYSSAEVVSEGAVPKNDLFQRSLLSETSDAPGVYTEGASDLVQISNESEVTNFEIVQVIADPQNTTLFGDFYYNETEDSPVALTDHQFVLTGD